MTDGSVFLNAGIGFNDDAINDQDANNKKNLWDFSNGPGVANTKTWTVTNIGIHDWEVTAFERSFILRERPNGPNAVPEGSSALLLGLGLVVLVGAQRALGWRTLRIARW